jgi:putative ATP-binding cassette transporter
MPFFRSEKRAIGGLVLLLVCLLTVNGLNVVNSYVGRDLFSALAERDGARFYAFAGILAGVFVCSTVAEVMNRYIEQRLGLRWREWLTRRLLDRYLADRMYQRLLENEEIDNPDQRISEDLKTFTSMSLAFLILLANGVLTLIAFAGVLWSITPWLFLTALLYALAGTFGTILLGRRLVPLDNLQLRKEADFRYALGRVREHAHAVAQLGGEEAEKARLGDRLNAVVANFRDIIGVSRDLGFFTTGYNYLTQIVPAMVVAPLDITGQVAFGTVTQSAMAFTQVLGAFSLIVVQQVSQFAAVIGRLGPMWEVTEPGALAELPAPAAAQVPPAPAVETVPSSQGVTYDHLTLHTPKEGRPLVRDLSLEVSEGRRVVITGPNGCGKSALFLATAGLWRGGNGRIVSPGPHAVMFVPQHPYTPSGRLRDLLLYGLDGPGISDERLVEVLREVGLEAVIQEAGGLDAECEWANTLSEGEQQALAFARVLLANPQFAFIDNPAGALDGEHVQRLYAALARSAITYVSVGDHPTLASYHDMRLDLHGDGSWELVPTGAMHSTKNGNGTNGVHT